MGKIKFSILVPAYNAERYIKECIDSAISQTYKNFELIIVDDGSTDNTAGICDEYAKNDNRINVIHKENGGVILARRTAIKEATGDYFVVLDSDDKLIPEALSHMYEMICRHNCDMLMYNYSKLHPNMIVGIEPLFEDETVFEGEFKDAIYKLAIETNDLNSLCTKVVSRNIVDTDADYSNVYDLFMGEDLLQCAPLIANAKKIVYTNKSLYLYRLNVGMTKKIKCKHIWDITRAREGANRKYINVSLNLKESIIKGYENYLNILYKHLVCGYMASPALAPEIHSKVFATDFYKDAKNNAYKVLPFYGKWIIYMAEKKQYWFIFICGALFRLRRLIRKSK